MELISIDEIHRRAKTAGLSIRTLCKRAGVPRSTWEGWRSEPPITLTSYTRIVAILEKAEAEVRAQARVPWYARLRLFGDDA